MREGDVREGLLRRPPDNFAEAIRRVHATYSQAHGKRRYGDKTPANLRCIPLLADPFPEGRFVHIVRAGRDVAPSYLDVTAGSRTVERIAVRCASYVVRQRDGHQLGPSRYRVIRHEDLFDDPEGGTLGLCAFLDLDFQPAMLRYHERAEEIVRPIHKPEEHRSLLLPPTRFLRDWRRQLPGYRVAAFEALAGDALSAFGSTGRSSVSHTGLESAPAAPTRPRRGATPPSER